MISEREREFLEHSNYIEREYSREALEDAEKAWIYALRNRGSISTSYVLGIHKRLMKRLNPDIAGKFRNCAVYIGGRRLEEKEKEEIEKEVGEWIDFCSGVLNRANGRSEVIEEKVKECHVKFEYMHPFRDGNGRTGRILMNIQRINAGLSILTIHEGEEQMEYYRWFKNGSS